MFARKRLPVWALVVVLILALAGLGLGYAHWWYTLTDSGTVTTGKWHAYWDGTFTDDGGHVDNVNKDDGDIPCADDPNCIFPKTGPGSESARDPSGPGPNPPRYDKAIGHCASWVTDDDGKQVLHWEVSNAYPSYYCTVWAHIINDGSVPMKIYFRSLTADPEVEVGFIEAGGFGFNCGDQIDPGESFQVGMWIHVKQTAVPNTTYSGSSEYKFVNWNEFESSMCQGF